MFFQFLIKIIVIVNFFFFFSLLNFGYFTNSLLMYVLKHFLHTELTHLCSSPFALKVITYADLSKKLKSFRPDALSFVCQSLETAILSPSDKVLLSTDLNDCLNKINLNGKYYLVLNYLIKTHNSKVPLKNESLEKIAKFTINLFASGTLKGASDLVKLIGGLCKHSYFGQNLWEGPVINFTKSISANQFGSLDCASLSSLRISFSRYQAHLLQINRPNPEIPTLLSSIMNSLCDRQMELEWRFLMTHLQDLAKDKNYQEVKKFEKAILRLLSGEQSNPRDLSMLNWTYSKFSGPHDLPVIEAIVRKTLESYKEFEGRTHDLILTLNSLLFIRRRLYSRAEEIIKLVEECFARFMPMILRMCVEERISGFDFKSLVYLFSHNNFTENKNLEAFMGIAMEKMKEDGGKNFLLFIHGLKHNYPDLFERKKEILLEAVKANATVDASTIGYFSWSFVDERENEKIWEELTVKVKQYIKEKKISFAQLTNTVTAFVRSGQFFNISNDVYDYFIEFDFKKEEIDIFDYANFQNSLLQAFDVDDYPLLHDKLLQNGIYIFDKLGSLDKKQRLHFILLPFSRKYNQVTLNKKIG